MNSFLIFGLILILYVASPAYADSYFSIDDVSLSMDGLTDKSNNGIEFSTNGEYTNLKITVTNDRDHVLNYFLTLDSESGITMINHIGIIPPNTSKTKLLLLVPQSEGEHALTLTVHDLGESAKVSMLLADQKPIIGEATFEYSVISKPSLNEYVDLLKKDDITFSSTKILSSSGTWISEIHNDQEYLIQSLIKSDFDQGIEYVNGVMITDENGNTIYENKITRHIIANSYDFAYLSWIPVLSGNYMITVSIWDNENDLNLLAEPQILNVIVYGPSEITCVLGSELINGICQVHKMNSEPSHETLFFDEIFELFNKLFNFK